MVPFEEAEVERVHRLAVLEHDIVRDVDDVVDGTDAAGAEPLSHPAGRRGHTDVLDDGAGIAVALVGSLDVDLQKVVHIALTGFDFRCVELQRDIEGGSGFSRETDDTHAVGTVRRDLELGDDIVETDGLTDVHARDFLAVVAEDEDTILDGVGEVVDRDAQFGDGAHHALRDFTAHLALGDLGASGDHGVVERDGDVIAFRQVLRGRDDLERCIAPDIDLADPELVGVLMFFQGQQVTDDDVLQLFAFLLVGLDLGTGDGDRFRELSVLDVQVDIIC